MKIGSVYKMVPSKKKCGSCGHEGPEELRSFPFGEKFGILLGVEPSGFLSFRLSGQKFASMNGGSYEEVLADITFCVEEEKCST